ncbi:hypothetical protein VNO77_17598 [Canavalia gladiata]|uniref:Uncharacterized protein n=1 Tax=Canavalia gladiata TaxID=3824 RepID=A0AAN9QGS0_CANGL
MDMQILVIDIGYSIFQRLFSRPGLISDGFAVVLGAIMPFLLDSLAIFTSTTGKSVSETENLLTSMLSLRLDSGLAKHLKCQLKQMSFNLKRYIKHKKITTDYGSPMLEIALEKASACSLPTSSF